MFARMPLDYYFYDFVEMLLLSIIAFIFSIFPQIMLTIYIGSFREEIADTFSS